MASMRLFTLLLVALLVIAVVPREAQVEGAVNVDVPVLTKSVVLDGQATYSDEWSDTTETRVILELRSKLVGNFNPTGRADMSIRAKHDARWLFLLLHLTSPGGCTTYESGVAGFVAYYWGVKIGDNWEHSDLGTVNSTSSDDFFGLKDGLWKRDTDFGGQNNVEGSLRHPCDPRSGGTAYWAEFRRLLDSGDEHDWVLSAGLTYYVELGLSPLQYNDNPVALGTFSQYVTLNILDRTTAATNVATTSAAAQTTETLASVAVTPFGTLGMVGLVAAVASVSSVLILVRRKKTLSKLNALLHPSTATMSLTQKQLPSAGPSIPTGYADLDAYMGGGLPEGYSVVLISPSYDERDLLVRRFIEAGLDSGRPTFYISADLSRVKDLVGRHGEGFYGFLAGQAGHEAGNLNVIPGIETLSELNIAFNTSKPMTEMRSRTNANKIILLDILSDVLLRHKALTTRKWLSEFATKRKTEGFTILGVLDPSIAPRDEIQTILSLFDGVIEIFEKELAERSRRFIVIKKLYGRRYNESELMLDKEKLF